MHIKNKRGQSTVEYVLLVTAVIAVIIAMVTSNKSGLQSQLNSTFNQSISAIGDMGDRLSASTPAGPLGNGTPSYAVHVNPGNSN